ncbi:MAG: hypothetical protein ABR551_11990 [Gemmatimonadales bacterium]
MTRALFLLVALMLVLAALAEGQRPQVRRGFWMAGGGGIGHTTSDCEQCNVEQQETGSYLSMALGGTVGRNVLVGAEMNSWHRGLEDGDESLLGVFTVVQWYPWDAQGLHLRTGVGWSYARSGFEIGEVTGTTDKLGLGLRFGAGWDFRVRRMLSISPFLGIHVAALGDTESRGGTLRNLLSASRQVGVGVTIH